MKLKNIIISLLFLLVTMQMTAQYEHISKSKTIEEKNGKEYYVHKVAKRQTLYSIAKEYNVSLDELYSENPELKNNTLSIGQKIWIPVINKETELSQERKTAEFDFFYHVASDNETFAKLSQLYNVPERYIRLANNGLTAPFKKGEYIKIPIENSFAVLDRKNKKSSDIIVIKNKSEKNTANPIKKSDGEYKKQPKQVSFNPNVKVMPDYRHVVLSGENLKDIAEKYQITVNDLKLVNPGLANIKKGDRLRLPAYAKIPQEKKYVLVGTHKQANVNGSPQKEKTQPDLSKYFKYTVKKGDNIFKISRKFGVSTDDIYNNNPSLFGKELKTGEVILIPKLEKRPEYVFYKVSFKTKLKKVASLYGVSKNDLKRDNPKLKNRLLPGQIVRIKGGEEAVLLPVNKDKTDSEIEISSENDENQNKRCIPSPDKENTLKIALMVPLFLEQMEEINYYSFLNKYQARFKPFWFVKFLEGALLAVDSLKKEGYKLEVYIYDVDDQITKTVKVLQRPELKNMNMIIGPFYSKSFDQVAMFAGNFGITMVNPFTFREQMIEKYHNIIKVKPGAMSQIPLLKQVVKHYYRDYKVFVISQNKYQDVNLINNLKKNVSKILPEKIKISNIKINNLAVEIMNRQTGKGKTMPDSFILEGKPVYTKNISENLSDSTTFSNPLTYINYINDSIHPFVENASAIRNNLVIIYGNNKAFVMDVLNRLNVLKDTFNVKIIGMPYWEQIKRSDYQTYNNLELTYFSTFYVDTADWRVKNFEKQFISSYKIIPDEYAYAGFDITWFFVKTLADYNKHFKKCLPSITTMMFENGFHFKKAGTSGSNFENTMWNILKIKDYKIKRLPESNIIPFKNDNTQSN